MGLEHVAGGGERGERGAQLVGDVGHEAAVAGLQDAQLGDGGLEGLRHAVEGPGQVGQLVAALLRQAGLELALLEALDGIAGAPDRMEHATRRHPSDGGGQQDHHAAHRRQDVAHQGKAGEVVLEREEEERAGPVGQHPAADHDVGAVLDGGAQGDHPAAGDRLAQGRRYGGSRERERGGGKGVVVEQRHHLGTVGEAQASVELVDLGHGRGRGQEGGGLVQAQLRLTDRLRGHPLERGLAQQEERRGGHGHRGGSGDHGEGDDEPAPQAAQPQQAPAPARRWPVSAHPSGGGSATNL